MSHDVREKLINNNNKKLKVIMNKKIESYSRAGLEARKIKRHKFDVSINKEIETLKPDNYHGPVHVIKEFMILSLLIYLCVAVSPWFYIIALPLIGARQRGLTILLHDASHRVLAKNKTLNIILGTLFTAWPVFQKFYSYQKSHVHAHHKKLGILDQDPDLTFFHRQAVFEPDTQKNYFLKIFLFPLFGSKILPYLKYVFINRYQRIKEKLSGKGTKAKHPKKIIIENVSFYSFWIVIMTVLFQLNLFSEFIIYWIIPYLTAFHIIGWFIELSEHGSCSLHMDHELEMSLNRKSRGLEVLLTGMNNGHYHLDHHLRASTPFWLLPKANEIRLRDPDYRDITMKSGGLFHKGLNNEPSIVSIIFAQNKARFLSKA